MKSTRCSALSRSSARIRLNRTRSGGPWTSSANAPNNTKQTG